MGLDLLGAYGLSYSRGVSPSGGKSPDVEGVQKCEDTMDDFYDHIRKTSMGKRICYLHSWCFLILLGVPGWNWHIRQFMENHALFIFSVFIWLSLLHCRHKLFCLLQQKKLTLRPNLGQLVIMTKWFLNVSNFEECAFFLVKAIPFSGSLYLWRPLK